MTDRYRITMKQKNTGELLVFENEVFNPKNGVAFFEIGKDWDFVKAERWTGKKDINGNYIFEGDTLIDQGGNTGKVEWNEDDASYIVQFSAVTELSLQEVDQWATIKKD